MKGDWIRILLMVLACLLGRGDGSDDPCADAMFVDYMDVSALATRCD
jgi:hypothetical protein